VLDKQSTASRGGPVPYANDQAMLISQGVEYKTTTDLVSSRVYAAHFIQASPTFTLRNLPPRVQPVFRIRIPPDCVIDSRPRNYVHRITTLDWCYPASVSVFVYKSSEAKGGFRQTDSWRKLKLLR
jgi:hypothetical protein